MNVDRFFIKKEWFNRNEIVLLFSRELNENSKHIAALSKGKKICVPAHIVHFLCLFQSLQFNFHFSGSVSVCCYPLLSHLAANSCKSLRKTVKYAGMLQLSVAYFLRKPPFNQSQCNIDL